MTELRKITMVIGENHVILNPAYHVMQYHQLFRIEWLKISQTLSARWLRKNFRRSYSKDPRKRDMMMWPRFPKPLELHTTPRLFNDETSS